ncbi:MAG: serine protease [Solirubrobacteraceae bacterium]|nr:serine protease [Solirubrobacteraceae bacterium]
MSKLPAVAAVCMTAAVVAGAAPAAQGRRVLVAVERDAYSPAGSALAGALPDGSPMYLVKVPHGRDAQAFARQLSARPHVLAAQVNHSLRLRPAQQSATGCEPKPDPAIRTIATATNSDLADVGGPTRPIAILDTGIDPSVAELAGRVLPDHDVVGGFTVPDQDGHGTEVAAVAAGAAGGMRGVSPTSPVFSVRIFNSTGNSSSDIVVKAITAAVAGGAGVINISAAGAVADATATDNRVMTVAIAQAFNAGVMVVAPSGNEGKTQADAPGAYPHVLTAGSGTALGGRDLFSNSGPWVDLLSVGSDVLVPTPASICTTGYARVKGTSFAAPAVAGAAAILQAVKPGIKPQQLFDLVRHAATDVGLTGWEADSGFGFLNVLDSMSAKTPPLLGNEVDDDIMFAKLKPIVALKLGKAKTLKDSLSAAKDNTDVFRIKLKKGEAISANVTTKVTDALFSVSLYDRNSGAMDLTNDVTKHVLGDSGGLSPTAFMNKRVKKSGTYYIAVETADTLQDDTDAVPPEQAYSLKLKRQKPLPKKKAKKK